MEMITSDWWPVALAMLAFILAVAVVFLAPIIAGLVIASKILNVVARKRGRDAPDA